MRRTLKYSWIRNRNIEGSRLVWFGTRALGKLFSPSEDQLEFFQIHGSVDIEHSNLGWGNVAKYARQLRMEDNVVRACRDNLVVWEAYLNGIAAAGDLEDA